MAGDTLIKYHKTKKCPIWLSFSFVTTWNFQFSHNSGSVMIDLGDITFLVVEFSHNISFQVFNIWIDQICVKIFSFWVLSQFELESLVNIWIVRVVSPLSFFFSLKIIFFWQFFLSVKNQKSVREYFFGQIFFWWKKVFDEKLFWWKK